MGTMYTGVLLIPSYMHSALASSPLVSQALKGIERALASSQGLEEEERTARAMHDECIEAARMYRAMHDECIEAARMYRRILDKAATVGWMLWLMCLFDLTDWPITYVAGMWTMHT